MGQNQSDEEEEVELTEIQPLYTRFMKVCPSGALHLHEFRRIFGVQSSSEEEALYMETIFKSFDTNRVRIVANFSILITKQQFLCISCDYVHK